MIDVVSKCYRSIDTKTKKIYEKVLKELKVKKVAQSSWKALEVGVQDPL
jgi:hypothetical protein